MLCNRREDVGALTPYINKPVYIKGACMGAAFDTWVVLYDAGRSVMHEKNLVFDYRGRTYSVLSFLASKKATPTDSLYNNAIYKSAPVSNNSWEWEEVNRQLD